MDRHHGIVERLEELAGGGTDNRHDEQAREKDLPHC
jgi:hypothetical protein